jgi:hypothetical protein
LATHRSLSPGVRPARPSDHGDVTSSLAHVRRQSCGKTIRPARENIDFQGAIAVSGVLRQIPMPRGALTCLLLLTSTGLAAAATSANPLGLDYSEWFVAANQMATDASGALYVSAHYALPSGMAASSVTKLSPDGTTILWQDMLGFLTSAMAVSPSGDVFVVPESQPPANSVYVAKLAAGGSGVAWTATAGFSLLEQQVVTVLAADSQGRTYVAAPSATNGTGYVATVVRINAAGSAIDYTANVTGMPTSIAADGSGAVVVAGSIYGPAGFVARVAPDGSAGYYTTLPQDDYPALALDSSGNAVVFGQGLTSSCTYPRNPLRRRCHWHVWAMRPHISSGPWRRERS